MKVAKFRLADNSRFHFGAGTGDITTSFSSDRLFSALINNYAKLYPEDTATAIKLFAEHKVQISSLFYGLEFVATTEDLDSKTFYFLPKPILNYFSQQNHKQKAKNLKKAAYCSLGLIGELSQKYQPPRKDVNVDELEVNFLGNRFALLTKELAELNIDKQEADRINMIHTSSRPKVRVDRWLGDNEQNLYFQEDLEISYVKLNNYLLKPFHYFLYKKDLSKKLRAAVYLTAEEGLGGKRTTGAGSYQDCYIEDIQFDFYSGAYRLSLSSVYPKDEEIDKLHCYQLNPRQGYIYANRGRAIKKPETRVLTEGSIFTGDIKGMIKDITPELFKKRADHPVYLNGTAFLINFGGGDNGL